ncbi:MAG: glycosyltransferase [Bacteroidales bacterium]|nr:glycosyltransferase [Bacteroidales bacterium]
MNITFWHHEIHGPINLEEIWTGQHGYGGSVSRLRILFWLAKRGHVVQLIGNVISGNLNGVTALTGIGNLESRTLHNSTELTILVINDAPSDENWQKVEYLPNMIRLYWAGVPFPFKWLERIRNGSLARIVCVSRYHRDLYRIYRGFEHIEYSYSGVDLDLIDNADCSKFLEPTVLFVSIPRRTKGFHNILSAWNYVRKEIPNARLRVCGAASMHDPNTLLGKTGILDAELEKGYPIFFSNPPQTCQTNGIDLMGSRNLASVYSDIKGASVAVVNTNWNDSLETYCRSAVEVQASGVPVVGAKRGSLPEVVKDGVTGILVDKPDPNKLGEAIVKLLIDRDLRQKIGRAAKDWARSQSDYAILAQDWEDIVQRAKSGTPAPIEHLQVSDYLRNLGYGQMRLWLKRRIRHFLGIL